MMSWPLELSFTLDQAMVVGNDLIDLALIDTETLSQEQPWSERAWQVRERMWPWRDRVLHRLERARECFASMLYAAHVGGYTMTEVRAWIAHRTVLPAVLTLNEEDPDATDRIRARLILLRIDEMPAREREVIFATIASVVATSDVPGTPSAP